MLAVALMRVWQPLVTVPVALTCAHIMGCKCWLSLAAAELAVVSVLVTAAAGSSPCGSCGDFGVDTAGMICIHYVAIAIGHRCR